MTRYRATKLAYSREGCVARAQLGFSDIKDAKVYQYSGFAFQRWSIRASFRTPTV